jgi:putative redox protein
MAAARNERIVLSLGDHYDSTIRARSHSIASDEPLESGGHDKGPAPWELLLSAMASCTAITLRMYAERKGWSLTKVDLVAERDENGVITMGVAVEGDGLNEESRARLEQIAHRCPVVRGVQEGLTVREHVRVT